MKETGREYARSGSASAAETDWQQYFASLGERLALSDYDANVLTAEQINAIDTEAPDSLVSNCPPNPPDGFPDATSQRFYLLSQIVGDDIPTNSPECGTALACFLSHIIAHQVDPLNTQPQVHSHATLVVDRRCVVRQTLTLPNRFTLVGVGPDGEGSLSFENLPDGASALQFAPTDDSSTEIRMSTIRDIRISGEASCCAQVGINVTDSEYVYIDRVRMSGFAFGVLGENAFSIFISNSSLHGHGVALMIGEGTTSWRVRDSGMSQSWVGAVIAPTARGHVITGAQIENNDVTGVLVNGTRNVIASSWFEGNGTFPGENPTNHAIRITNSAEQTRVLSNYFSSQGIGDAGAETQSCFNMSFAELAGDVNQDGCV